MSVEGAHLRQPGRRAETDPGQPRRVARTSEPDAVPAGGALVAGAVLFGGVSVVAPFRYLVGQTLRGTTKAALYVYATEARVPESADPETLDGRTGRATPGTVEAETTAFR